MALRTATFVAWASLLVVSCGASMAQVTQLPFDEQQQVVGRLFHRAIRFSQIFQTDPVLGQTGTTTVSGELAYSSGSERHPFMLGYSGGGMFTVNSPLGNTVFQNFQLLQGINRRDWDLTLVNTFSYLPQSPTAGLAGIPGVGDLEGAGIGSLPPGILPNQSVLANNAARVSDAIYGETERRLGPTTSLSGSGSFGVLNFPSGKGINSEQESATGGVNFRLNPLNVLSAGYQYARYEFTSTGFAFQAPSISVDYRRQWNRTMVTQVSFGPQWILSSDTALSPNRTLIAGDASVNWQLGENGASIGYSRGASGGSGALGGGELDDVLAAYSRNIQREWTVVLTASYAHTSGLQTGSTGPSSTNGGSIVVPPQSTIIGEYGGFQVTRRIGRSMSAFVSYTAQHQTVNSPLQAQPVNSGTNLLNGFSNIIGFGFGFTPTDKKLAR